MGKTSLKARWETDARLDHCWCKMNKKKEKHHTRRNMFEKKTQEKNKMLQRHGFKLKKKHYILYGAKLQTKETGKQHTVSRQHGFCRLL